MPERIYLDHAATSPLRPEAKAAMEEGFRIWANPSSPHAEGRKARAALEDARERIKAALGWDGELIFTSGASEALAIGLGRAKVDRRIVSAVEHDAVFRAAPDAEMIPILPREDKVPELDIDWLEKALSAEGSAVVAVQSVNSETGSYMCDGPEGLIPTVVRERGGLLLSDCSQSAGKFALPDADMVVISAHKFGGPIGIGALLVRDYAMLQPSGGQERGYRPGTENLPGAVGMLAALKCGQLDSWATTLEQQIRFRNAVVETGQEVVAPWQCPYIQALSHPTMGSQALLIRLDAMGFAVSAGSACSSGSLKPSRVLKAFGIDDETASRTIRVSIGWSTTPEELDAFAAAWRNLN